MKMLKIKNKLTLYDDVNVYLRKNKRSVYEQMFLFHLLAFQGNLLFRNISVGKKALPAHFLHVFNLVFVVNEFILKFDRKVARSFQIFLDSLQHLVVCRHNLRANVLRY